MATPFFRCSSGMMSSICCERASGRLQALRGRAADISVAEHRVLRDAVAVEEGGAVDEHRAGIAFLGSALQPSQALGLIAVLEEQQPERRLGVDMAFLAPRARARSVRCARSTSTPRPRR